VLLMPGLIGRGLDCLFVQGTFDCTQICSHGQDDRYSPDHKYLLQSKSNFIVHLNLSGAPQSCYGILIPCLFPFYRSLGYSIRLLSYWLWWKLPKEITECHICKIEAGTEFWTASSSFSIFAYTGLLADLGSVSIAYLSNLQGGSSRCTKENFHPILALIQPQTPLCRGSLKEPCIKQCFNGALRHNGYS
jgi:hypothetical protein